MRWRTSGSMPSPSATAQAGWLEDLLGLVALESVRNQCLVVGEDLGTVPETLRKALDKHGLGALLGRRQRVHAPAGDRGVVFAGPDAIAPSHVGVARPQDVVDAVLGGLLVARIARQGVGLADGESRHGVVVDEVLGRARSKAALGVLPLLRRRR